MKKKDYQVVSRSDRRALAEFLSQEGQLLLPMLELIEQAEMAVDELIDVAGRATIEAVLTLSAQQLAGPKHPGQATGQIRWHGCQDGVVGQAERKLRVRKPRLRRKGRGQGAELEIPAYEAMQTNSRLGQRILEILMHGVSTRHYRKVLPEMAETVGVSKSSVSREFIDASEKALKELAERRFDEKDLLIVYLDGLVFGEQHVIAAIGVDSKGYKHVLGLRDGASENATVCKALLADLVERGVKPGRRRLFVIDGSKALRAAIDAVYGKDNPVQRCRNHKRKNVLDHVSDPLKDTVKATMNAAYRLDADQGMARLEKLAKMLEKEHPSAAASLREGLAETFTVNRLGLPATLRRCLCTTNVIESPHSGVRQRTGRVSRWRDGAMVLRWVATAWLTTEQSFRRIMGYKQLWMLAAYLDGPAETEKIAQQSKVG
ncbi:MAG: IS256 family transposase [Candidatus Eisenbacteria sp.]|nr:IS256 family transposase [Candidatus Eisenbacteria bacterium]